jgi:hypothetical protein
VTGWCVWMMQEATEAHGGIFALCIAAAPRRLTSRFLNFLLSPVDCRRNRSQPFRLGISSTNPFPSTPRIPFSWHSLSPPSEPKHPLLDDRPEQFFLNLPQGCLSAVTQSLAHFGFPFWARVPFQTMPCRLLFVALPRLPSPYIEARGLHETADSSSVSWTTLFPRSIVVVLGWALRFS